MFAYRKYRLVLPVALGAGCIGLTCWIYLTGLDTSRLFEFAMWTGFATMAPGLLVAMGASDNAFEEGESYDAVRDAAQKQERIRGSVPILVTTVLAGTFIIIVAFALRFLMTWLS